MKAPVRIGITLGDVNGIGPEIALKAATRRWPSNLRLVLIGSDRVLRQQASALKLACAIPAWDPFGDEPPARKVTLWDPGTPARLRWKAGKVNRLAAAAAAHWIEQAAAACMAGRLDGMVTAPINKKGLQRAGIPFPGHTEMLAHSAGVKRYAMMLIGGPLRVVLVTRHIPLCAVPAALTRRNITEAIRITAEALHWMGFHKGQLAVCGLNPHAGDGGAIGREEQSLIKPALRAARAKGLRVEGPLPADTVFHFALTGRYQAVVAMYHDQGLAPLKALAFNSGVNVTLGLPFVRTSPDHGTAYDIAGKGKADPSSTIEALKLAHHLAERKNPWAPTARSSR